MRKTTFTILLITIAAAILRFYQIETNPKAMYGDGLTAVYDAYSILKTGHDQKGNFLPLVFSLGGGRPGGYVYATIPFVAIFGPTALASQMVSVLSGIGIVLLLYLIGKKLFSEKAGLVIAAITSLNPWELSLSRGPFESHFALFLTLLGFFLFLKGLSNKYWFILSALSFALASQTYSTFRLTIPIFALLLIFLLPVFSTEKQIRIRNFIKQPILYLFLIVIITSTMLSVYLTISRGKEDRFDIINIFKNQEIRSVISQKVKSDRALSSLPSSLSNILHTPQVEFISFWAENYFRNFLPDFLFIHGDGQVRHNPAEMGGFLWVDAFFLILGIIYLFKFKKELLIFLFLWIALAPIPTSLVGGPHALRSSLLLPPLLILTGLGVWKVFTWKNPKKTIVLITLGIFFVLQYVYFIDRFYFLAPKKNVRSWSYPAKQAVKLAEMNKQIFDFIILSNDIDNMEFAYPTYNKLDPNLVIKQNKEPFKIGEFKFFKYGNVYIGSLPDTRVTQFINELPGSVLYVGAIKEKAFLEIFKTIRGFDKEEELVIAAKSKTPDLELID